MTRLMLTDERWSKLRTIMRQHGIYDKPKLRMMIEGMLYRMRVGCPWRDLPKKFGPWNSVYKKFNRWSLKNKLMKAFKLLCENPDIEREFIDASIVRAHQHSAGAAEEENQAIGRSKGGNSTKIHLAVDTHGRPIYFEITGGEVSECKNINEFIDKLPISNFVIADKGYDSEKLREYIESRSSKSVIPRRCRSRIGNGGMNWGLYKLRHLIENVFARLKHFRGIATRYDKLKRNYESTVAMGCCYVWLSSPIVNSP